MFSFTIHVCNITITVGFGLIMFFFYYITEDFCQQKYSYISSSKVGYWCRDDGEGHYKKQQWGGIS